MDRKNRFKMKSGYFLIIVLCLCSCNNQFEKQDIVGAWESDELHYVIHLFDNDSCLVSNLPRNEMISVWNSKEHDDTTRIDVKGVWKILDIEEHDIFINIKGQTYWLLYVKKDILGRKSKWKLYYSTMDEDEYVEYHTFSRLE